MSRKNSGALALISLMLCFTLLVYFGGAITANSSQQSHTSGSFQNTSGSSVFAYQQEMGPLDENFTLSNRWASRVISVGDYGLVTVNDTLLVTNNGTNIASSWTFYIPQDVSSDLGYLAAYGNRTKLDVLGAPSFASFVGMKVDFAGIGGLPAGASIVVTLIQQYSRLGRLVAGSNYVGIWFYRYLISPYETSNYITRVNLPSGASSLEPSNSSASIVSPFNCTRLSFISSGGYGYIPLDPLVELSVNRRVEITVEGYLATTETYHVTNLGPTTLSKIRGIHFSVPTSVLPGSLYARDSTGQLSSSINETTVTVEFEYDLNQNWSYTYYVSYKSSLDDYRISVNGQNVLKVSPITAFNGTIDSESFSLVLPPRAQLANASPSAQGLRLEGDQVVATYAFQNVTYSNVGSLEFRYSDDAAQAFQRPILLTFGIFVMGLIYVGIRKIIPKSVPVEVARVEEERARGLTTTLKEFCSNYEEKTALMLEIEKLADDRRKGRLSKRAYVEEVQHDRRRIASLTNSINEAKNKLVPANKRYAAMIKQLDTYEEERENARASLDNLELRRRQGKVSGDVYNRLKYDNTKKIEKATSGIDSVVVQLRQETL